jgi:hypothetical protein
MERWERVPGGLVAVREWLLRPRPRRRAMVTAGAAAAAVMAAAVAMPLWLGGTPPAGTAGSGQQPPGMVTGTVKAIPLPAWTVTVNGRTTGPGSAELPQFGVARGERVTITMTVTVPVHDQLTKFFLGITGDSSGIGPRGPIGMQPVLATAERLGPGKHSFTVRWTVPRAGAQPAYGYEFAMAAFWPRDTKDEPQAEEGSMVTFVARH